MENQIAISVIIALYKGEQTMDRMVNSVLEQTFTNYELILVNDGSPDKCGLKAEDWRKKDPRIHVINKANEGLAMARNDALKVAKGKYSIQFDQDDWVDKTCLEELYYEAELTNADMVICDYYHNDEYRQKYTSQKPTWLNHWDVLKDVISGRIYGYCWNKLIRNEIYTRYHITYPKEFYGCEDQYGISMMLREDIKISHLPKAFYHYVYVQGSLSRHYDENTFKNDLVCRDMFYNLLKDTPIKDLAYKTKSQAIIYRAFLFGYKFYSSEEFKQNFAPYKQFVNGNTLQTVMLNLSIMGYYRFTRRLFEVMFNFKQLYKRFYRNLCKLT